MQQDDPAARLIPKPIVAAETVFAAPPISHGLSTHTIDATSNGGNSHQLIVLIMSLARLYNLHPDSHQPLC